MKFCPLDGEAEPARCRSSRVEVLRGGAPAARRWIVEHGAELDAAILTDAVAAEALLLALRLESRARLIYRSAWSGAGTPEWRERSIWRSVEAVLHGSEQAASAAEWLEPAADVGVLGASPETVAASLGLDSPPAEAVPARRRWRRNQASSARRQLAIRRAMVVSQVKVAARASPSRRSRSAVAGSSIAIRNASAIARSSSGSTSSAASPAVSPVAVVAAATTGAPHAIASITGSPKPS